jgi:hypothetical protein
MWLLVALEPRPDAPYWPGRRWLAAFDAALWPLLWVLLFSHVSKPVGIVGPFVAALALLCALGRLHRALWLNHRYWFTTWQWAQMAAALMLMGVALKLSLPG